MIQFGCALRKQSVMIILKATKMKWPKKMEDNDKQVRKKGKRNKKKGRK